MLGISIIQNFITSLEFFFLVIAVTVSIFLACAVYLRNPTSATHRIFFFLSMSTILWLVSSYVVKVPAFGEAQLLLARLGIFFAAPMSALFFLLAHTLPGEQLRLGKTSFYGTIVATVGMMVMNISPYAFIGVSIANRTVNPVTGNGIIPFALISTFFSILAVYFLFTRIHSAHSLERQQLVFVLAGILLMLCLIIGTILVPVLLFNSALLLPLVPLYTLIFLGMTAYAIVTRKLFDLKVLVAQAFTLALWVILFARLFSPRPFEEKIVDVAVLALAVIFGIFLIRSVKREVTQRESIEKLAKKLAVVNEKLKELDQRKSEFLSMASHQLRTPLTAIKGYASMLLEGSFGDVGETVRKPLDTIFKSSNRLVQIIEDFLTISRIEQNRLTYNFETADLKELVSGLVADFEEEARKRGLALTFSADSEEGYGVTIDKGKIMQIISNIIDNAVKYTPKGSVAVAVRKSSSATARVTVTDTGIGMDAETKKKIFQKFSRAKDANLTNITGTGLGLYVATRLIVAHKGKIWAESKGKGKGSAFYIELPLAK